MSIARFGWAAWALVPVGAMAFHYGPGQGVYRHDQAADLRRSAVELETQAAALQAEAYATHLASLEARRAALVNDTPAAQLAMQRANETETRAFAASSAAWKLVADTFGRIEETAQGSTPETLRTLRWSRARALVRSGDIWSGIDELEGILADAAEASESALVRATREQLGAAYYYGARLMRLSGEPDSEWMIETAKARQHFRYLAERAAHGASDEALNQQRNVELVLNLEQEGRFALEGKPLPKESPSRCIGNKPGGNRKNKRPPTQRDARGAGGAEDIYTGW
ncbi:MAG: hypothetical protein ACKVU4_14525 [Phycisphaerales bacterium]